MPPKGDRFWWFDENSSHAYHPSESEIDGADGMETQYDCGYAEYYHVDKKKCIPMNSPLDNVDRVKPIQDMSNEEFDEWEYNREVAELEEYEIEDEYDEIDPGLSEYNGIMDDMMRIEMQTQGMSFKEYVRYGIHRDTEEDDGEWDNEIELLTIIYENGYTYYTHDPRPE